MTEFGMDESPLLNFGGVSFPTGFCCIRRAVFIAQVSWDGVTFYMPFSPLLVGFFFPPLMTRSFCS